MSGRIDLLGVAIDPLGPGELVARIVAAARGGAKATLFYANAHTLVLAGRDAWFARALRRADTVFCDGFGACLVARILGLPVPPRATPPDWIDALCRRLAGEDLALFLLGGAPGVAAEAAAALRSAHPGLRIAGVEQGYFVRDGAPQERVIESIRRSGAGVLLVGMGQPRQELWIDAHRGVLPGAVLAVGALFEWLAGTDRRAPRWASSRGLEWAFRLVRHPLRHFDRYVIGLPHLLLRAGRERLRRLLGQRRTQGPLRVALSFAPTDRGRSGAFQHMRQTVAALASEPGVALHVFALERDRALLPGGEFARHSVAAAFGLAPLSILWHRLVLPWRARAIGARVLHLPYANRRATAPRHPPTLATVFDLAELELGRRYGRLRGWHAARLREQLGKVTLLLTLSRHTRRALVSQGVDPERVRVVPGGMRALRLPDRAAAGRVLKERFGLESLDLLYVSRIEHPGKNHVRLLDALALLRSQGRTLRTAFAGEPWNGAEVVAERIERLGLERSVWMTGFVSEEELGALYVSARALVFPSLVEGFGLPVAEALGIGLPVACSDRAPMNEEFAGAARLFDPEDPKAIAEALIAVLQDEELRKELVARGRERVKGWSWEGVAREVAGLYRELGGGAG